MISDLKGITHINRLVSAGERIDLRILTSGFYIVHMISNDKLYVAKMIKK